MLFPVGYTGNSFISKEKEGKDGRGDKVFLEMVRYRYCLSYCKVSDKNYWIVITDYDVNGRVNRVVSKKPGQKIDGIEIKVDYWYWFEGGKLCEKKG